jgi:hypothetical protein
MFELQLQSDNCRRSDESHQPHRIAACPRQLTSLPPSFALLWACTSRTCLVNSSPRSRAIVMWSRARRAALAPCSRRGGSSSSPSPGPAPVLLTSPHSAFSTGPIPAVRSRTAAISAALSADPNRSSSEETGTRCASHVLRIIRRARCSPRAEGACGSATAVAAAAGRALFEGPPGSGDDDERMPTNPRWRLGARSKAGTCAILLPRATVFVWAFAALNQTSREAWAMFE